MSAEKQIPATTEQAVARRNPPRPWWRRKRSYIPGALAALCVGVAGSYLWPLVDPNWAQDECTFGEVSNARYRELLEHAKIRAKQDRKELKEQIQAFESERAAQILQNQIDNLLIDLESNQERVAAAHAVIRANWGEFMAPSPDTKYPFLSVTEVRNRTSVNFLYRFNINLYGVMQPIKRWSLFYVSYPFKNSYNLATGELEFEKGKVYVSVVLNTILKGGDSPRSSRFHPVCPPVPNVQADANTKESGAKQLAGAVLTARVSEAVDASIREQIKAGVFPVRLKPGDWASGEIVWLLDVIAPTKPIATRILSEVSRARFAGQKALVHPIVAGLVDKDVLRKVGGEGGEAA